MTDRETARDIQDQAADWAVKLDAAPLGREAQVQFDAWLAGDSRSRGALLRARAGLSLILAPEAEDGVATRPRRLNRRMLIGGMSAAAAAVGALVLIPTLAGRRYSTDIGEIRRVPLADGSLAAINTNTEIAVDLQPDRRSVRLDRGEAWFQVAKDPARPFVVMAGAARVRAVGTAFSVRRRAMGIEVLVTEGVVEVWSGKAGATRRVSAGNQIFVSDTAGPAKALHRPLEMDRALAWREGQIVLDGDTIAAAVSEFNRYNTRKIVITDPQLEGRRIVGWFHTNEPESFARAVAASEKAGIDETGDVIMLGG
jgi:transmembrane sensor